MTLAVLGLALSMAASLRAESLDGTQWKVHSMKFWKNNKLKFDAGQVTKGKGTPTAYTTSQENGKTTWKADMTTPKGSKVAWTGTVDGDHMTVTSTVTDAKGKTKTHKWKARKCAPKKDKSAPAKP
jgi:hypothetical protein